MAFLSGRTSTSVSVSPCVSGGSFGESLSAPSSSSSAETPYAARYPANLSVEPEAR